MLKRKVLKFLISIMFYLYSCNSFANWENYETLSLVTEKPTKIVEAHLKDEQFFDRTFITIGCRYSYPQPSIIIKFPSLTTDIFRRDYQIFVSFFVNKDLDLVMEQGYRQYLKYKDNPKALDLVLANRMAPVIVTDSKNIKHKASALNFMNLAGLTDDSDDSNDYLKKEVADTLNNAQQLNSQADNSNQFIDNQKAYIIMQAKPLEDDTVLIQVGNDFQSSQLDKLYNLFTTENYAYLKFRQGENTFSKIVDLKEFNEIYKNVIASCASVK